MRWAEWTPANGAGLRLDGCPYLRLPAPGRLRTLSGVEGRPAAKFQRAEQAADRVDATPGTTLTDSVTLRPLAP